MTVREAMIVAGGRGTRLAPLTDACPKPLLPLVGVPFLAGQIRRLGAAGIERVSLVVGADTTPFEPLAAGMAHHGVDVVLVPEPEPLDTAGGVRSVIAGARGPVVVCNGDILTDVDVEALVAAHLATGAAATLSLIRVDDPSSFGVCVRNGTRIIDFVEKPEPGSLPGQDTVNAGTYVLEPSALLAFPEGRLSFESTVFPGILAGGGHVEGRVWEGVWADLGTPARYLRGHRLVLDEAMPWPGMDELEHRGDGVRVHPSAVVAPTARMRGPVAMLAGALVEPGAEVGPHVVLGAGSRVQGDVRIRRSVLLDDARIGAGTVIEDAILGRGAVLAGGVGPLADVVLGDHVRVGAGDAVGHGSRVAA